MSADGGGAETLDEGKGAAKLVEASEPEPSGSSAPEGEGIQDEDPRSTAAAGEKPDGAQLEPSSPHAQGVSYPQMYPPHLTPQPGAGYYLPVYPQPQVTPEQSSPGGPHAMYDVSSFLQQQVSHGQFGTPGGGQYSGIPQPPLSPRSGSVPPASPLFPRASGSHQTGSDRATGLPMMTPGTPVQGMSTSGLPYLSPAQGSGSFGGMYPAYAASSFASNGAGSTASDEPWRADRSTAQTGSYPPPAASPQPYVARASRSYSFDEMLPPPMLEHQDSTGSNPSYSPYSGGQGVSTGGPLLAQQHWGYATSPGEMYNGPPSPLQPRSAPMMGPYPGVLPAGMGVGMRPPLGPQYGQPGAMYYPTSPGPPIQTAGSNKGPDGANLFIFHIPNNFTNLDMYNLFCPYGNLLSVRIMVERDTGRSRGFGFVSYDNPESAASAIKELNGYAIGNKRLKVQHKQIRAQDQHHGNYGDLGVGYSGVDRGMGVGRKAESTGTNWYDENQLQGAPSALEAHKEDTLENQHDREVQDTGDPSLQTPATATTNVLPPKLPEMADEKDGSEVSPLGRLEPLRTALPEIGEGGGS